MHKVNPMKVWVYGYIKDLSKGFALPDPQDHLAVPDNELLSDRSNMEVSQVSGVSAVSGAVSAEEKTRVKDDKEDKRDEDDKKEEKKKGKKTRRQIVI